MRLLNLNEAVYYIRLSLHIRIARQLNNGTSPDSIDNGKTITSYVGSQRYNTICKQVGADIRIAVPEFKYPNGFVDNHTTAKISDFAYDAARVIFPMN